MTLKDIKHYKKHDLPSLVQSYISDLQASSILLMDISTRNFKFSIRDGQLELPNSDFLIQRNMDYLLIFWLRFQGQPTNQSEFMLGQSDLCP